MGELKGDLKTDSLFELMPFGYGLLCELHLHTPQDLVHHSYDVVT